jgi:hypothetical protein
MKRQRLKKQPEIPFKFWNLIQRCLDHAADKRPGFDVIVKEMVENEEFLLPGVDKARCFEYQRRITANVGGINPPLTTAMRLDGTMVRTNEPTSKRTSRYDFIRLKEKQSNR